MLIEVLLETVGHQFANGVEGRIINYHQGVIATARIANGLLIDVPGFDDPLRYILPLADREILDSESELLLGKLGKYSEVK